MAQTRAKTGRKVAALETLADAAAQVSAASEYTVNSSWSPPGDVKTAPSSPGSCQDSDIDELDDQFSKPLASSDHENNLVEVDSDESEGQSSVKC
ncbi:hypothetical protein R3P38DRAFT_3215607 [Favolaschia claudopus]|uniref:Uncharacterized protein n=1 Tax=Favolaschia claudopus TaxID=2862362 RepID=A0AAW0A9A3_9AGAR